MSANNMNNAERLRSMSDKELAYIFAEMYLNHIEVCLKECPREHECDYCIEKWLKKDSVDDNLGIDALYGTELLLRSYHPKKCNRDGKYKKGEEHENA